MVGRITWPEPLPDNPAVEIIAIALGRICRSLRGSGPWRHRRTPGARGVPCDRLGPQAARNGAVPRSLAQGHGGVHSRLYTDMGLQQAQRFGPCPFAPQVTAVLCSVCCFSVVRSRVDVLARSGCLACALTMSGAVWGKFLAFALRHQRCPRSPRPTQRRHVGVQQMPNQGKGLDAWIAQATSSGH